jgi:hypothetical protein
MSRLVKGADLINQFGRNLPTPVIDTIRLKNMRSDDPIYEELSDLNSAVGGGTSGRYQADPEESETITRIDVDISVLMNTWDGFKAEELSKELFQTVTSNDETDNESLYINIFVSRNTSTTSKLKSSRLNLKNIFTPASDLGRDFLTNKAAYDAENYQLLSHLSALTGIGQTSEYIVSVPLSDFYDTVQLTAVFDEDNNPIIKMSQISVTTYIKELPEVENLTYFATISNGNPIILGTSIEGPAARLSPAAYALNFSDVSYEDVMRDGRIAAYAEPAYMDEQGLYYPNIPLRGLNLKYYKTDSYSRNDIFAAIDSLLSEYSQYLSTDVDLKDAIEGIMYIMSVYGEEPDFINRLNRTGQIFAVTKDVTRTSRLYERYRILVKNIDAQVRSQPEVVMRVLRNYKIVDSREFVAADFDAMSHVGGLISTDFLYSRILHTNVANYVPIANQSSEYPGTAELPVTPSERLSEFNEMMSVLKNNLQDLLTADLSSTEGPRDGMISYYQEAVDAITEWVFFTWADRFVGGGNPGDQSAGAGFNKGESEMWEGIRFVYGSTDGPDRTRVGDFNWFTNYHAHYFGYTPEGMNAYNKRRDGSETAAAILSQATSAGDGIGRYKGNTAHLSDLSAATNSHEEFLAAWVLSSLEDQLRVYVPRRRFPDGGSSTNPETAPDSEYDVGTRPSDSSFADEWTIGPDEDVEISYGAGQNVKEDALDYVGSIKAIENLATLFGSDAEGTRPEMESFFVGSKTAWDGGLSFIDGFAIARRKMSVIRDQVKILIRDLFGLDSELRPVANAGRSTIGTSTFDSYLGEMPKAIARDTLNDIMQSINVLPAETLNSESERAMHAELLTVQAYGKIDEHLSEYLNNRLCRIMVGTAAISNEAAADAAGMGGTLKAGKSLVSIRYYSPGTKQVPMIYGDWSLPANLGLATLPGSDAPNYDRFIYEFGSDMINLIRADLISRRDAIKAAIMEILRLQGYYVGTATDIGIHSALAENDIILKKYGYFFFDMEKYIRKQSVASQVMNIDRFLAFFPAAKQITNNAITFSKAEYINHNFGENGVKLFLKKDLTGESLSAKATRFEYLRFGTPLKPNGNPYVYSKVNTLSNITFDQITEYSRFIPSVGADAAGESASSYSGDDAERARNMDSGTTSSTSSGTSTPEAELLPDELDMASLLADPAYQPSDQYSMLALRNYAFPGFSDAPLYAGTTWRDDYRLMCFNYQIFIDDDDAFFNPFFKNAPYSNDWVTFKVELFDESDTMIEAIVSQYHAILEEFNEYFEFAIEGCAYDNYNQKFNDFFVEQMLGMYPEPRDSPWFRMVAIFTLYMNIFTNAYNGDKAQMEEAANVIIESVRPETGSLRYLLEFHAELMSFSDSLKAAENNAKNIANASREDAGPGSAAPPQTQRTFTLNTIVSERVIDHIGDYTVRADKMDFFDDD